MIALSTAYKEALIGIDIKKQKAYKSLQANCKHSENLLLSLDEMLEENGAKKVSIADLARDDLAESIEDAYAINTPSSSASYLLQISYLFI